MSVHVRYTPTPHLEDAAIAKKFGPSVKVLEAPYLAAYDGRNIIDFPILSGARYLSLMSTEEYTSVYSPKPTTISRAKSAMLKSFRKQSCAGGSMTIGASTANALNESAANATRNPRRPSENNPTIQPRDANKTSSFRRSNSYAAAGRKRSIRIAAASNPNQLTGGTSGAGPAVTKTAVERAQQQSDERALQVFRRVAPPEVPVVDDGASHQAASEKLAVEMRKQSSYFTPNISRVVDAQAAARLADAVIREENASSQAASLVSSKGKKDASSASAAPKQSSSAAAKLAANATNQLLSSSINPSSSSPLAASGGFESSFNNASSAPSGNNATNNSNNEEPAELPILQHSLVHYTAHRRKQTALTALIPATEAQQEQQHNEAFALKVTPLPVAGTLRETDENIQAELCSMASRAVVLRQSFTVVNMGMCQCGKTEFGTTLLDKLIESIGPAVERALETHADELARAREDAVLLASAQQAQAAADKATNNSNSNNSKGKSGANVNSSNNDSNSNTASNEREDNDDGRDEDAEGAGRSKGIVPALSIKSGVGKGNLGAFLRSRSPASTGRSSSRRSRRAIEEEPNSSRFVLYVPAVSRPLPAVRLASHLVPSERVLSALGIHTPRQIPSGRAASEFWLGLSEEEEAAARREELEAQQALLKAAQKYTFGRKSSFKLKQSLYELIEGNRWLDVKNLEGNGRGESWSVLHWNGVDSLLELPPIPQLEIGIKSFILDFWIYRPSSAARRGSSNMASSTNKYSQPTASSATSNSINNNFNTPEILLQISEPSSEKGMLLRVGINTALPGAAGAAGDNCEVLQLLVRDANNRNMEVVLPLTDFLILNPDEFHHVYIAVKSLEDTQTEIRIDGHPGRVQYAQMERPNVFGAWLQQKVNVGGTRDAVGGVEQSFFGSICEVRMWRHPEGPSRFDAQLQQALVEYRRAETQRQLEGHALDERGASAYSLMHEAAKRRSSPVAGGAGAGAGAAASSINNNNSSMLTISKNAGGAAGSGANISNRNNASAAAVGSGSVNTTSPGGLLDSIPPALPSLAPLLKLNVDRPIRAEFAACWSWPLEPRVGAVPFEIDDDPENIPTEVIELEQGASLEDNDEFRPASPAASGGNASKQQASSGIGKEGSPKGALSFGGHSSPSSGGGGAPQLSEGVVAAPKISALRAAGYDAPKTCPQFDGQRLAVNMTPLGPFGEYLHSFNIEIRFRCSNSKRVMSLLGVTDTQVKKQEIGIVLNAEPAMGSIHSSSSSSAGGGAPDRYKFHPNSITMFLVDATGRCLSAVLRGTERSNLIDGKWHTLVWRVLDSETNKLEVKVDNQPQEAVIAVKESPKNFVAFQQWVCLGGHNARDWKVKNIFEGSINRCAVSVRGENLVEYKLSEGNGATVAIDETGHAHHGTYWDPQFMRPQNKFSILWVPQRDDVDKKKTADDDEDSLEHVVHMRNDVRFAVLCITVSMDVAAGKATERIYDLLRDPSLAVADHVDSGLGRATFTRSHIASFESSSNIAGGGGGNSGAAGSGGSDGPAKFDPKCTAPIVELQWGPTSMRCYRDHVDESSSQTRTRSQVPYRLVREEFLRLPDSVYRDAETTKQVRREISRVMKAHASLVREGKAGVLDGHILVVCAVGDARLAYLDLRGPFWPHHSQYDLNMKRWIAPLSNAHGESRRVMLLNLMTLSIEKALLAASRIPTIARRTLSFQKARDLCRHLECHNLPSNIGGLLHWLLLDIEFANHVHLIHSMWKVHSEDDAAAFSVFNRSLTELTRIPAALMVQKVWRGHAARKVARNLSLLREIRRSKIDEVQALRKGLPAVVLPKKTLTALVILNLRSGRINQMRSQNGAQHGTRPDGSIGHTGGSGGNGDNNNNNNDNNNNSNNSNSAMNSTQGKNIVSSSGVPSLSSQQNTPAYFDCLDNDHWLPPIDDVGPQSVIAGLNAQGYVVHKLVDASRDEILDAIRSLDPSHMNFVYMCGYGTSILHYPVHHAYECHFLEQKEETLRSCVDRDFGNILRDMNKSFSATMKDMIEKRDAALAAKKKKKKTNGGGAASSSSASSMRRPAPPASNPSSGRRGVSRAAAAADAAQAAAAQQTQIALQIRETEYAEAQTRTDLQNYFYSERSMLRQEFDDFVNQIRLFEDACVGRIIASSKKESNQMLPFIAYVPADADATAPFYDDVLLVQEVYDELFRRSIPFEGECFPPDCPAVAAPDDPCRGLQSFLAIDIIPMSEALPRYHGTVDRSKALAPLHPLPLMSGASIIASSTGHSQVFFHDLRQKMMLTWHLRKVLIGHVEHNFGERAHPARLLNGGVIDPEPGMRDVPSIFEYLSRKLAKKTVPEIQSKMRSIEDILESNLVYFGDVLPVRKELMNEETRHQLARQAESKRVHSLALVACKPERGAGEIQNELQAHLSDLQTVEVVPQCSLLVTFLRQVRPPVLRTLDRIDLTAIRKFVRRALPRHLVPPQNDNDVTVINNNNYGYNNNNNINDDDSFNIAAGSDPPANMAASLTALSSSPKNSSSSGQQQQQQNQNQNQYVTFDVHANALGVRIDFFGLSDKNKLVSVISGVALKLTTASFPALKTSSDIAFYCDEGHEYAPASGALSNPSYDVNDVEALYTIRGVTNARRFKNVLKRWVHNSAVGTSVRVIVAHGYSTVDNSEAGFSYV